MAATSLERLEKARRLLEAGERAAALTLIKAVLYEERRNVRAWWLAAHAAPNQDEAAIALRVVLKLQPDHAPARAALDRLGATARPAGTAAPVEAAAPATASPKGSPVTARPRSRTGRNLTTLALILLSMIVMSGGGLLFILNLTGSPLLGQIETGLSGGQTLPTATPALIGPSAQVQDVLNSGETQVYRFFAEADTEMFVGVGFATVASDADTSGAIDLIDPEGYRVASSSPEGMPFTMPALPLLQTGNIAVLHFTLDMRGVWEIRLNGREGTSSGAYVMLMECAPESNCVKPPPGALAQPSN